MKAICAWPGRGRSDFMIRNGDPDNPGGGMGQRKHFPQCGKYISIVWKSPEKIFHCLENRLASLGRARA